MGLALSYRFNLDGASISQAREKVAALHRWASNLPFLQVGELIELEGNDCLFKQPDPHILLKVCALTPDEIAKNLLNDTGETKCYYLIGFNTLPGKGCAEAAFGLATSMADGDKKDWRWQAFCKTQYANNADYGGIENFLKCHLLAIRMFDAAQYLGILSHVGDPSGYWDHRDLDELVRIIEEQTLMMAAVMGGVKDAFEKTGYQATAPILNSPDFEYLEAMGNQINFSSDGQSRTTKN